MKVKIVEIKHRVPSVCSKYILKYRRFGCWATVGRREVFAGGNCIGACEADYLPQFVATKFESKTEAGKYALSNFKKVEFI